MLIKLHDPQKLRNNLETNIEIIREKYISPELRQKVVDYLRLEED